MTALSLRPGDRVPDFVLPGLDGKLRKFIWSFTGRAVALLAVDDLETMDAEHFAAFAARCKDARVTSWSSPARPSAAARPPGRSSAARPTAACCCATRNASLCRLC